MQIYKQNESHIEDVFQSRILEGLLGYQPFDGTGAQNLKPKQDMRKGIADIALGSFSDHEQVENVALRMLNRGMPLESANLCFTEILAIGSFELRHGFISSWPAFALLFHKIFGNDVLPWLPSLFLAALGQADMPRLQLELNEVLNFHECHPVASLCKYG